MVIQGWRDQSVRRNGVHFIHCGAQRLQSDDSAQSGSSTSAPAGSAAASSSSAGTTAQGRQPHRRTGRSGARRPPARRDRPRAPRPPRSSRANGLLPRHQLQRRGRLPAVDNALGRYAVRFDKESVRALFLCRFPLSLDNVTPANDYYNTQYLNVHGESNKWLAQGGYLRQRPLGITPSPNADWQLLNMEAEVRSAIARGITGFTFDIMSTSEAVGSGSPLQSHAERSPGRRFSLQDSRDAGPHRAGRQFRRRGANHHGSGLSPAAYRLSDGRLVVSAFDASLNSAGWWQSVLSQLSAKGINVAFVPTFLGWSTNAAAFAPISYGFSDWGTATAIAASQHAGAAGTAHSSYGKIFMMPVDPQQFRPKDFVYWEAGNSAAFRAAWASSIQGDADWVQVVTWNDYSESGQISPYTDATLRTDIGTGYYDLNGYYAAWFLTGQQPQITHDVLYYFYRREPTTAPARRKARRTPSPAARHAGERYRTGRLPDGSRRIEDHHRRQYLYSERGGGGRLLQNTVPARHSALYPVAQWKRRLLVHGRRLYLGIGRPSLRHPRFDVLERQRGKVRNVRPS